MNDRYAQLADAVGQELEGTVTTVLDTGAFVDIGGVEGLLHVRDMGRSNAERAQRSIDGAERPPLRGTQRTSSTAFRVP